MTPSPGPRSAEQKVGEIIKRETRLELALKLGPAGRLTD